MALPHPPAPGGSFSLPPTSETRLDRWLRRTYPLIPFGAWARWMRTGQIRLNGARVKGSERVSGGEILRLPPAHVLQGFETEAALHSPAPPGRLSAKDKEMLEGMILSREPGYIVLNKPAGLAVQGGSGTLRHLDGLLQSYGEQTQQSFKLVHRLDKDTSGILLVATSSESAAQLSRCFQAHEIYKFYLALTVGVPKPAEGAINAPLCKLAEGALAREKVRVNPEGAPAITYYQVLENAGQKVALVGLSPLTGRTHQLRAHLAHMGTPILGDGKYGGRQAHLPDFPPYLHLHSYGIVLTPHGSPRTFAAPLSEGFKKSMEKFGFSSSLMAAHMEGFFQKFYADTRKPRHMPKSKISPKGKTNKPRPQGLS